MRLLLLPSGTVKKEHIEYMGISNTLSLYHKECPIIKNNYNNARREWV